MMRAIGRMTTQYLVRFAIALVISAFAFLRVVMAYDLSTASYDSKNVSVQSQCAHPYELEFDDDGDRMYIACLTNDIFQYTLTTAWDVSTASYASKSFDTSGEESGTVTLAFNSDGTKMYSGGTTNDTVFQYSLSTAFDVSTATYDSVSFDVGSQESNFFNLEFSTDGTKMYVIGNVSDKIHQYTLSTAWDLSTASYDSKTLNVNSQAINPLGMQFHTSGTYVYVINHSTDRVYQYSMTTAWDVSTGSYDNVSFYVGSQDGSGYDLAFKDDDGTKMFVTGNSNDRIYQYTLTNFDTTDPTLSSSSPADNATDVTTTDNIVLTFSEAVDAESGDIVIYKTSDDSTVETMDVGGAAVSGSGSTEITVNPTSNLDDSTEFYVIIDATAFDDASSNSYAGISASTTLSFTTADETNPTVSTYSPADNATSVSQTANLVLTFSEAVDVESGNIVIYKSSDDSVAETIAVTDSQVTGTGTTTITINPSITFAGDTEYYVQIAATGFDDSSSNSYAGITDTTTWSFTVEDANGPTLSNEGPEGQKNIGTKSATLSATTNETSNCRYSTSSSAAWAAMTAFETTGGTSHASAISGLENGTTYNYYVFCQDSVGNQSSKSTITFNIAQRERSGGSSGAGAGISSGRSGGAVGSSTKSAKRVSVKAGRKVDVGSVTRGSTSLTLPKSSTVMFKVKEKKVDMNIAKIEGRGTNRTVEMHLPSEQKMLKLKWNEIAAVDIDGDGVGDLAVKFAAGVKDKIEVTLSTKIPLDAVVQNHPIEVEEEVEEVKLEIPVETEKVEEKDEEVEVEKVKEVEEVVEEVIKTAPVIEPVLPVPPSDQIAPQVEIFVKDAQFQFKRDVGVGTRGEDVKELQKFLNSNGFPVSQFGAGSQGNESEYFGNRTRAALIKWQKAQKFIKPNGVMGIETRAVMNGSQIIMIKKGEKAQEVSAPVKVTQPIIENIKKEPVATNNSLHSFARNLRRGDRGEDVKQLQIFLNNFGFPVAESGIGSSGNETSYFGSRTQSALIKYQKAVGAPSQGFFGPATRDSINK